MSLRLKDFIAIALVTIFSFPVLYIIMLFVTGAARVEFGHKKEEKTEKVETVKYSFRKDSLALVNSKTFQAMQKQRSELEEERVRLIEQQKRIDLLQREIEEQQKALTQKRGDLEKVVSQSDSLELKKTRDIAKMYAAMRPAEAAQIIETLKDDMAAKILKGINDDRQKAKILAALSKEKANRITSILSAKI